MFDPYGPGSNLENRVIRDHGRLKELVDHERKFHPCRKIVMTSGVYDLTHIGHCRYLEAAKACGDILIVALDCDAAVTIRKGPDRPVVPEDERAEMLAHLRHVDVITFDTDYADDGNTKFSLLELIRPDVFVASLRSFTPEQTKVIDSYVPERKDLPSQAETSTSAKVRKLTIGPYGNAKDALQSVSEIIGLKISEIDEYMKKGE